MHLNDAVDLPLAEVGKCDIVAKQEGEPLIIILEIQGLPHTRGELVDKAEHAVVGTAVFFVAEISFKIAAERFILRLLYCQRTRFPVPAAFLFSS